MPTDIPRLPLGKKPARKGAVTMRADRYLITPKLPSPPRQFGHEAIGVEWGMLGNDDLGVCVPCGGAHEHMLWTDLHGDPAVFTRDNVIDDYSAITGYVRGDPSTDNGTDMQAAASYRRKTGLIDSDGVRHQVIAYLAIDPRNIRRLEQALWLFGAVGLGVRFPESAYAQMNAGKPWSYRPGSRIVGGHYIPLVAKRKHLQVVTWGRIQEVTRCFIRRYADEALVYVSAESLDRLTKLSPEGFDVKTLLADLAALR